MGRYLEGFEEGSDVIFYKGLFWLLQRIDYRGESSSREIIQEVVLIVQVGNDGVLYYSGGGGGVGSVEEQLDFVYFLKGELEGFVNGLMGVI